MPSMELQAGTTDPRPAIVGSGPREELVMEGAGAPVADLTVALMLVGLAAALPEHATLFRLQREYRLPYAAGQSDVNSARPSHKSTNQSIGSRASAPPLPNSSNRQSRLRQCENRYHSKHTGRAPMEPRLSDRPRRQPGSRSLAASR